MNESINGELNRGNSSAKGNSRTIQKLFALLDDNIAQSTEIHRALLASQRSVLDISSVGINPGNPPVIHKSPNNVVFTNQQLREFGTGSIAKCFGNDFKILDSRKSPRIPNGELLLIDQITEIKGDRLNFNGPASVTAEYTVPKDAWYLKERSYAPVPLSMLMEIALQPCGILSAYLGTSLMLPPENNQFRNLDGKLSFVGFPGLPGKTIVNRSILQNAFSSGGMHIQKYSFALSVDGMKFIEGESTFGYFSEASMAKQAGISTRQPQKNEKTAVRFPDLKIEGAQNNHFDLSDSMFLNSPSSTQKVPVILGEKKLSPDEWFYVNHFFQDPVMPGSLGAEAIMRALWAYASGKKEFSRLKNPIFSITNTDSPFTWKYRGQVTPKNMKINYEVHIKNEVWAHTEAAISADGDFWVDGLHIYSFNNLSLSLREG